MTDLPGQGRLFGPPSAREQYDQPPSLQPAKERLSRQCEAILARLKEGPATNRELADIAMKYTSRISDLRKAGHAVTVFDQDHAAGFARYRLG